MSPTLMERARADLTAAIERLRSEEGFRAWLEAKKHLYVYSPRNQFLIWTQRPTATLVRGRRQWAEHFNRELISEKRHGQKPQPIWILAPRTKKIDEIDPATGEPKRIVFFRGVRVYDIADTVPIPGEPEIPIGSHVKDVAGDDLAPYIPRLIDHAESLGFEVNASADLPAGVHGYCDHEAMKIVFDEEDPPNAHVHVLIHELAHAHGITYKEDGRSHAEACAEAAAYVALSIVGFDVSTFAVPYIAEWADDAEDVIAKDAERIDRIAKEIAAACDPENAEGRSLDRPASG